MDVTSIGLGRDPRALMQAEQCDGSEHRVGSLKQAEKLDLLIRAGRLVCSGSGLDQAGAVAVRAGRIAGVGPDLRGPSLQTRDYPGGLLLPGLVDLHAHPGRSGVSKFGVDPDTDFLPRGVTTVLSQGDAGADNWEDYRENTLAASRTRVRLAINLSARGESMAGGCFERLRRRGRGEVCDGDPKGWRVDLGNRAQQQSLRLRPDRASHRHGARAHSGG